MNRVVAGVIGLAAGAAFLVGCSDDKGSAPSATAAGNSQVSTGGSTEVKVDGKDLAGLDVNSVTCVKQGGKINVASGAVGGQQGLGIVMTDEATPTVESLGMVVDGNALAVTNTMGAKVGSAEVKVDGSTYTITGEATGADISNPMAGMITKPFTVKVDCS
ncbi:lipoprotein LpqH [Mycobacterium sp. B14F4]|uniref:lipoprotein LpqH n=1 Tax=Mycobacterium sp. B14F4 TaxID=3153565 RepID=UPI00325C8728